MLEFLMFMSSKYKFGNYFVKQNLQKFSTHFHQDNYVKKLPTVELVKQALL